ncbi:H-NS histone family protein [Caballeronia hypogeia]|uniref:H-NS histone family protein n=1 Tax=Caballeronia hypogeia TaxID=1777140 RepID=UPI000ACBF944
MEKQLAEARDKETRLALIEIVQKMREYGITLNELMGRKPGVPEVDAPARYQDPLSGATWSGRGRAPNWIAGKNRDEFLVDRNAAARAMVQAALFPEER